MAEGTAYDELEVDDGVIAFEVGLSERGDEGSSFRTRNDPSAPLQRGNLTERKGTIDIRCIGKDVIHGYLKDGESPATLVVYEFQFDPRKKARRIVTIDIEFVYSSQHGKEPEVVKVSPKGRMTLVPTIQTENLTRGGEAKVGSTAFGAELGVSGKWEKAVTRETKDATTVVGSIDLKNRSYGASNAASWTLMENKSAETGVPAHFRAVVLLRRGDDEQFQSTFKIKASVDLVSTLTRIFSSTLKDDPILYDPSLPPTNNLRMYDAANLDTIDLHELSLVSFTNYSQ